MSVYLRRRFHSVLLILFSFFISLQAGSAQAALIVDPPQPITQIVTVQPIIVSNTDGSNTAEYFGTPTEQSSIEGLIDSIWAQAGIDVTFLTPSTWNNDFANIGISEPAARPTSDLSAMVSTGNTAGVTHADPLVINMFFVQIAAGFIELPNNTANGLAFVGGNGVSQHVGDDLPDMFGLNGHEVIASVVAHEIGHNLGLFHIVEADNLMQSGASGERLNATQIMTALNSTLSVSAVPEPSFFLFLTLASIGTLAVRRVRSLGHDSLRESK